MGNRLSKIYTRTGDDGTTGLGDGTRVQKDSARVEAYGTVDELNSAIGIVLACDVPGPVREALVQVQHDLFDLGGELCIPGMAMVHADDIARLERVLDAFNADLPALKEFILPGGGLAAAHCHLARTICRRAERAVVTLARDETVRSEAVHYLNRLSDLLFVTCRVLARASGHGDVLWQHERRKRPRDGMNAIQALAFVERHGIVLESARHATLPSIVQAIAGKPVRGSWWGHPQGREIFAATRALRDSPQILTCRIVDDRISFVHERLWPALARLAERFPAARIARLQEVHTTRGRHRVEEIAFPLWLPVHSAAEAGQLEVAEAEAQLAMLLPASRSEA